MQARRISEFDEPHLAALYQNPDVMRTLSADGQPLSDEKIDWILKTSIEHWEQNSFGLWVFFEKETGLFIGRAGIRRAYVAGKEEVEVAYALVPEFWGQGFATEMTQEIVRFAFEEFQLPELVCFTLVENIASQKVMERSGFEFEKRMVHAELPHLLYRMGSLVD